MAVLLLAGTGAWAQNGVFAAQPVGTATATPLAVTVTASATGIVASVEVLTAGAASRDFTVGSGTSTCAPGYGMTLGTAGCTESVTFTPTAPGVRAGAVVLLDASNNVLGMSYLTGIGQGGLGVLTGTTVATYAGSTTFTVVGNSGNILPFAGDGGYLDMVQDGIPATTAELDLPSGVAVDGAGNLYIADTSHNRIRMVCASASSPIIAGVSCPAAGIILTIAGTGSATYSGDGGAAASATLNGPSGVAVDGAGNLYIADTGNNVVRMISAATGDIRTVAGNSNGTPGYQGDGSLATSANAELNGPEGIALDAAGDLYIADTGNNVVRMVSIASGVLTTVAGADTNGVNPAPAGYGGDGGAAASVHTELHLPTAVAFDSAGNWYIADTLNNCIRAVNGATGDINTVAGQGPPAPAGDSDGAATATARLNAPTGLAIDPAGNLYIADAQNNAIRKVSAASGDVSTLAVDGVGEYYAPALTTPYAPVFSRVSINKPFGLTLDSSADLFFSDKFNNTVREIQSNFVALDVDNSLGTAQTPVRQGATSPTYDQTVEDDGNAPLTLTTPDITLDPNDPDDPNDQTGFVNDALDATQTTCPNPTGTPFLAAEDNTCVIGAVYAPSLSLVFGTGVSSMPLDARIYAGTAGDTVNAPLEIEMVGVATPLNSTSVTLTSSLNPSTDGTSVTFTATVTTGVDASGLNGTVNFYADGTEICATVAVSNAKAACAIATLTVGTHTITAVYSGDSGHYASPVATLTPNQVVNEGTTTVVTANPVSPSLLGTSVTFTATVTPGAGGVALPGTDTVSFTDNGALLCANAPLVLAGGVYTATCTAPALTQGAQGIVATYSGNVPDYIEGSSGAWTQDVQVPSSVTLTSSSALVAGYPTSTYGSPVTLTIKIPEVGSSYATGKVNLFDGATQIGSVTLATANAGVISFVTTSPLPVSTIAAPDVLTADYVGNAGYSAGTSNAVDQVVTPAATATAVSALPVPAVAGGTTTITATVTVTGGASTPGGQVTFTDNGTGIGSGTLSSGTASLSAVLNAGANNIVATYAGDPDDAGSQGTLALTVDQAVTTTSVTVSANPAIVLAPVTFTATVASVGGGVPTGNVAFTASLGGSAPAISLCASAPLTAGVATCTAPLSTVGTYTITASYTGDTNDVASTGTLTSMVVEKIPTLTSLDAGTTPAPNPELVLVAAVVNYAPSASNAASLPVPEGTVTFTLSPSGTVVGSAALDSTGVATLIPSSLPPGNFNVIATYTPSDADHAGSSSVIVALTNPAAGFSMTVTPPSVTVATSQNVTVNVNIASVSGYSDTINLGCAALPPGVNCHFTIPAASACSASATASCVTLPATSTSGNPVVVSLTIDTNNPLGGGASAKNLQPGGRSLALAGLFLPFSLFFGGLFWRFRKRYAALLGMAWVLLLGGALMTVSGCASGFSQSTATPGTYTIEVTGTGVSSNITRYQNISLTITQ